MELINLLEGDSRLKISVALQDSNGLEAIIPCVVDTGCSTTMIDIGLAKRFGEQLADSHIINLGNKRYVAQAYRLHCIFIGSIEIKNVFVLAVQYFYSFFSTPFGLIIIYLS